MNYTMTEGEYNRLESVRGMLGLVRGLLAASEIDLSYFGSTDLEHFVSTQHSEIDSVLKELQARQDAQRAIEKEAGAMQSWDWMHALRIARGEGRRTPTGAEARITQRLAVLADGDESMAAVLSEWRDLLAGQTACS